MKVRIAWNAEMSVEEGRRNPRIARYRRSGSIRVGARMRTRCLGCRTYAHPDRILAARSLLSFEDAQELAKRLEAVYPPKRWNFKTADTAKRRPKATAVIQAFHRERS